MSDRQDDNVWLGEALKRIQSSWWREHGEAAHASLSLRLQTAEDAIAVFKEQSDLQEIRAEEAELRLQNAETALRSENERANALGAIVLQCVAAGHVVSSAAALASSAEPAGTNLERSLAAMYAKDPVAVATLCDEHFDPSGGLLGRVRALASSAEREPEAFAICDQHGNFYSGFAVCPTCATEREPESETADFVRSCCGNPDCANDCEREPKSETPLDSD